MNYYGQTMRGPFLDPRRIPYTDTIASENLTLIDIFDSLHRVGSCIRSRVRLIA